MYYLAFAVSLHNNRVIDKVAKITTHCAIIVTGYGFVQMCVGLSPFEMAQINSGLTNLTADSIDILYAQGILRPFATFSGPWVFGDFLVIAFMFNFYLYLKRKIGRWSFFLVSLWLGFGILVSLSRSSYLMLGIAVSLLYILQAKSKRRLVLRLVLASMALGLIIIAILLFWRSAPPGIATAIFAQHNLFGRIEQWQSLLSQSTVFSLVGLGIGSEQAAFYFGDTIVVHTHSFLFTLLLELGVIGVGLFLMTFFILIRQSYRRLVLLQVSNSRLNLVVILSILMSMFIVKTVAGGLWGLHIHDNYLWLLFGLLAGSIRTTSRENTIAEERIIMT